MEDESLYNKITIYSDQFINNNYSLKNIAKEYIAFYKYIIKH